MAAAAAAALAARDSGQVPEAHHDSPEALQVLLCPSLGSLCASEEEHWCDGGGV